MSGEVVEFGSDEPLPPYVPPFDAQTVRPRVVRLSSVTSSSIEWLWPGWLPRGKIAVLDGVPGLGKSTMLLDLAARVSTGRPMPGQGPAGAGRPEGVVLLSAEDGVEDTIRPRLDEAGADVERVVLLDEIEEGGRTRPPVIPDDLPLLRDVIVEERAGLIVIDPLMAFLSSDTDSYRDQDVRRTLHQVKVLAEQTGAVVVVVRHPTKGGIGGQLAQYAGGGSVGIIGAARIGLFVGVDPADDRRRVLAVSKSNLAAKPPSLLYTLEARDPFGAAHVAWHGTTTLTADDVHAGPRQETRRDEVKRDVLAVLDGSPPLMLADLARALDEDPKDRTLRRALGDLVRDGDVERLPSLAYRVKGGTGQGGTSGVAGATHHHYPPQEEEVARATPRVPPLAPATRDDDGRLV